MAGYDIDAPWFYHDTSMVIGMDPGSVYDASIHLKRQLELINESWKKISDTLSDLKLSWAGETAQASDDFYGRLLSAQADMFGVRDEVGSSKAGIVGLLRYAAVNSSASFGAAEDAVTALCNRFADGLEAQAPKDGPGPADDPNGPVSIDYGKA
jgi:hypothetical protein